MMHPYILCAPPLGLFEEWHDYVTKKIVQIVIVQQLLHLRFGGE